MRLLYFAASAVLAAGAWEGYKAVGNPDGTVLWGTRVLPRADDLATILH